MAKNTVSYEALLVDGAELTGVKVDLFDLPYDKMVNGVRLMITEDVFMNASKGQQWPDFTNVDIVGGLDCCKFKIMPTTVLPATFAWLDCQHAIGSLDVLMGKIPETCEEIHVRHALFNNIKNNKDGALDEARAFVEMYPDVEVLDGDNSLADLLREIDKKQVVAQSVATVAEVKQVEVVEPKTDEWYSAEELISFCRSASKELGTLSDDVLGRLVQTARSQKANLKLRSATKKREDGADIVCVHRDDAMRVVEHVVESVADVQKRADAKKKASKKSGGKKAQVKEEDAVVPKKYYHNGTEVKVAKIKKYISKSTWRDLCAHCNKNVADLLKILNDINDVNVVPRYLGNTLGVVLYVKDNLVHSAPTLTFKEGKCLSQSFGTLNDRPRLVWGIAGNVLVAQKLFPEHEGKRRMEYNNYCSGLKIDLKTLDWSKYLLVSELIKELSDGRGIDGEEDNVAATELNGDVVAEVPVQQECVADVLPSVPKISDDGKSDTSDDVSDGKLDDGTGDGLPPSGGDTGGGTCEKSRARRPRIVRTVSTYVPPRNTKRPSTNSTVSVEVVGMNRGAEPVVNVATKGLGAKSDAVIDSDMQSNGEVGAKAAWQQVYSLSRDYEKHLLSLDEQKRMLLGVMAKETKAGVLLMLSKKLQRVLVQMKRCEDLIEEMQDINTALHKLYQGMHRKR